MSALILFVVIILHYLIQAVIWVIIAWVVASWLVQFGVLNMRNRFVSQAVYLLERITRPIFRPLSRIIPPMGGLDISPMIVTILLVATDQALLPALARWGASLG